MADLAWYYSRCHWPVCWLSEHGQDFYRLYDIFLLRKLIHDDYLHHVSHVSFCFVWNTFSHLVVSVTSKAVHVLYSHFENHNAYMTNASSCSISSMGVCGFARACTGYYIYIIIWNEVSHSRRCIRYIQRGPLVHSGGRAIKIRTSRVTT